MRPSRIALSFAATALALAAWMVAAIPPASLERALAAQQARVSDAPGDAAAWNDLGNLLALAGRTTDAETAYTRAVELRPSDTSARFNLGLLYLESGQLGRASDQLEEILDIAPGSAWAYYQLGVVDQTRGHRRAAINHYARAFALDPTLTFSQNNPHVLDNPWMTEALLRAREYEDPVEVQPARHYGDPSRIASLLLETSGEPAGSRDAATTSEERVAAGGAGATGASGSGVPAASGSGERPATGDPATATASKSVPGPSTGTPSGGSTLVLGPNRGVDPDDEEDALADGPREQDSPAARRAGAEAPRRTVGPGELDIRGNGEPTYVLPPAGGPVTAPPAPGTRFRPSRRSTASLEIELLPPAAEAAG